MQVKPVQVSHSVQPGEDYVWRLEFTAPAQEGKHSAFFRMQTGHSVRFGHKVWCDIVVVRKPV